MHGVEGGSGNGEDEKTPWWAYALTPFVLLFSLIAWVFRFWVGLLVLGLILGGLALIFGWGDKTKIADSKSCPGYHFVRTLKAKGQINTFAPIKPESGWTCEYSLDNEDAEVRFRGPKDAVEMEVAGRSTPAFYAANREARAEGFTGH